MITEIKKKLICADCLEQVETTILLEIESKENELKKANKTHANASAEMKDYTYAKVEEIIQSIKSYKSIINYLANMSI